VENWCAKVTISTEFAKICKKRFLSGKKIPLYPIAKRYFLF